ncbi:hypothetical protein Vadar_031107 [Vaccinium darrowii]|uniref:Uncharacterized protein n=1 Tax=Vaccinium darrowii TaxID=229202 RepID=A0ACB7XL87_9ERIC|nr:hypothetical protein Vadar_031107 [Vaccinium darrowii]
MSALRNLLSQGGRLGIGSSSVGRNRSNSGIWTSLHKAALLLQRTPHTQDFHTLPFFCRFTLPGVEALSSFFFFYPYLSLLGNSRSRQSPGQYDLVIHGEAAIRILFRKAVECVYKSLVCLALHQDDKPLDVFSGTVIRSDGIVATSANCLRPFKGIEYKIGVKVLHSQSEVTYEGVLLHDDLCSNIALIKIVPRKPLLAATFGKLELVQEGDFVVAAGCEPRYSSWNSAGSVYDVGLFSHVDIVMGNDEEVKNKECNNATTAGQLIKARIDNGRDCIGRTLVSSCTGVIGVIHNASCMVEATPIDDVLACLEKFEKNGEHAEDLVRA